MSRYVVTEPLLVANVYEVEASNRAEALQKVLDNQHEWCYMTDALPVRPMSVRDVRVIKRGTTLRLPSAR